MADISIRNVPDSIYAALKEQASREGKGLETWLRDQLTVLVSKPVIKRDYKLRATSEDGAMATIIRRGDDRAVHVSTVHCSTQQQQICEKAVVFVKRNEPGDREQAIALLRSVFEEVFELYPR
jgi:plasmid stability protein